MGCPEYGPCAPYATQLDLCCLGASGEFPDPCLDSGQPVEQSLIDNSLAAASELLWSKTGQQFGKCTVKIRPCRKSCDPCDGQFPFFGSDDFLFGFGFGLPFFPHLDGGVWFNISCGCVGQCGCKQLEQIDLPSPVCCIEEVMLDGSVFPASGYRVDEFSKLVRIDGGKWPNCQELDQPDTEDGTFSVTLTYGREVPSILTMATAELACEFLKACVGAPCQLPQRIASITRQGVTVGFIDPQEFWQDGRTGIYLVDLAVSTLNPHRLTRKPAIWSPDAGPRWRVTSTGGPCP